MLTQKAGLLFYSRERNPAPARIRSLPAQDSPAPAEKSCALPRRRPWKGIPRRPSALKIDDLFHRAARQLRGPQRNPPVLPEARAVLPGRARPQPSLARLRGTGFGHRVAESGRLRPPGAINPQRRRAEETRLAKGCFPPRYATRDADWIHRR